MVNIFQVLMREITSPDLLEAGSMCLLRCTDKGNEWPQVAKVLSVEGNNIVVQWFAGSLSTVWEPVAIKMGKHRRNYTESVHISAVVAHGWQLTNSNKLPQAIKQTIKDK